MKDSKHAVARLKEIQNTMSSMMKSSAFVDEATFNQRILEELRETQFVIAELAEAVLQFAEDEDSSRP